MYFHLVAQIAVFADEQSLLRMVIVSTMWRKAVLEDYDNCKERLAQHLITRMTTRQAAGEARLEDVLRLIKKWRPRAVVLSTDSVELPAMNREDLVLQAARRPSHQQHRATKNKLRGKRGATVRGADQTMEATAGKRHFDIVLPKSVRQFTLVTHPLHSFPMISAPRATSLTFTSAAIDKNLSGGTHLPFFAPKLRELSFRGCQFSTIEALSNETPLLRVLNAQSSGVKIDNLKLLKLRRLEMLSLANNPISSLAGLSERCPRLVTLNVARTRLTSSGLENIGLKHLTTLSLSGCREVNDTSPLNSCPALTSLDLSSTTLTNNGFAAMSLSLLQTLFLDGCAELSDIRSLSSSSPALKSLDLKRTGISDETLTTMFFSKLEELNVRLCNRITSLIPLGSGCPTLRKLDASLTELRLEGVTKLSLPQLEILRLESCLRVGDLIQSLIGCPKARICQ